MVNDLTCELRLLLNEEGDSYVKYMASDMVRALQMVSEVAVAERGFNFLGAECYWNGVRQFKLIVD